MDDESEAFGKHGRGFGVQFSRLVGSLKAGSGGDIFSVRKFDVFGWRLFLTLFWFGGKLRTDRRWLQKPHENSVTQRKDFVFFHISQFGYFRDRNLWVRGSAKSKHRWSLSNFASLDTVIEFMCMKNVHTDFFLLVSFQSVFASRLSSTMSLWIKLYSLIGFVFLYGYVYYHI